MKYNLIAIISVLTLTQLFVSCNNELSTTVPENIGFLEIQYDYQLNGVAKVGYERVNITDAFFKLYDVNDLDQGLKDLGFRKVELYLTSSEFKIDSLLQPFSQPMGISFAHITLVDSLGNNANPNRVLPYSYTTTTLSSFTTSKKNSCINFDHFLSRDTLKNSPIYKYSYQGQTTKMVNIIDLGNSRYQIIANGLYNSKIYNLYYIGTIRKEKNLAIAP